MKRLTLLMTILLYCFSGMAQKKSNFFLKGTIHGNYKGYIYIAYQDQDGKGVKDSVLVKNQTFSFKGHIQEPTFAAVFPEISNSDQESWDKVGNIYIEQGLMKAQVKDLDFKHISLTGSKTNEEFVEYNKGQSAILDQFKNLRTAVGEANMANQKGMKDNVSQEELRKLQDKVEEIDKEMAPYYEKLDQSSRAFFEKYPNSYITLSNLEFYTRKFSASELLKYYNRFSQDRKQSKNGKKLMAAIREQQSTADGSLAFSFSTTDVNEKNLSLADYKDQQYVLLDFWASWCVPCRKGNPHLKQVYAQYKDKGLEIIGVADDDTNHQAWKKAIDVDGIGMWRHVLRGRGKVDLSKAYNVPSLPTKILIDKTGKIIGRYAYEDDKQLDAKLAELLAK